MPPSSPIPSPIIDTAIIGAGAAGLATAIFARRHAPARRVCVIDGARKPGAKILVSGGGRCNVTNAEVTEHDFWGGKPAIVRRVLRALPVADTVAFFEQLGVRLREEPGGKLFPESNRARDVLDALIRGAETAGAEIVTNTRVHAVTREADGFVLETSAGPLRARRVVLATGGRSLPKTGSDGGGYAIAAALGHTLVEQTPALAPLLLADAAPAIHVTLSGVSLPAEVAIWIDGALTRRLTGALLWTHFGVSGPLALNASRHWARASLEGCTVRLGLNLFPERRFEDVDALLLHTARERSTVTLRRALSPPLPDAVALAILEALSLAPEQPLATLARADRRRLAHALVDWPLAVTGTRGYNYAEVTAGGVPLTEIDVARMESRICPGLHFAGEILDVDGRIGGFNFQWAWCTAALAGRGAASGGLTRS
jgi:predicted Rossmann fold flavoprotein